MAELYQRVGGDEYFQALVERFYAGVAGDPVLRPLYPDDLGDPKHHLTEFLVQYWGGPRRYEAERGHPRLRMRHAPFVITDLEREAWLRHMRAAVESSQAGPEERRELMEYFELAARTLVNTG